jgi:hypothetical protein
MIPKSGNRFSEKIMLHYRIQSAFTCTLRFYNR